MSFRGLIPHFFSLLNNIPLSECTIVYGINSPTKEPSGCFQVLAIKNKASEELAQEFEL